MARIKMHIPKAKLPFYPPCEVKCRLQNGVSTEPPKTIKEVQSLNGKIVALNRFVLKATDKCLPFFHILRKSFEWTDECQKAFEELKKYLSSPLLLSLSKPREELYLYLAIL